MRIVLSNAPPDRAEPIARALVESGLAACVNVIPGVVSVYRWKGNIERESESTLLIKTRDDLVESLMNELRRVHPYEVPEIVVLDVDRANEPYLKWIDDVTRD
jgi:periplasmic divalent cation tolerance protein